MNNLHVPSQKRLIQDIAPINSRRPQRSLRSRMDMSIGELNDNWRRRKKLRYTATGYAPRLVSQKARATYMEPFSSRQSYVTKKTRPLKALGIYGAYLMIQTDSKVVKPTIGHVKSACRAAVETAKSVPMAILSFSIVKSIAARFKLFPTKYTVLKGVRPDWNTKTFNLAKRYAAPAVGLMAIGILAVAAWQPIGPFQPNIGRTSRPTVASLVNGSDKTASSGGSTTPSSKLQATAPTSNFTWSTLPSAPLTNSTGVASPTVPNVGNVSSPAPIAPTRSPVNVPGVTSPEPITVPAQSIGTGGKPVVGTNPITVTLN